MLVSLILILSHSHIILVLEHHLNPSEQTLINCFQMLLEALFRFFILVYPQAIDILFYVLLFIL